MRTDDYILIVDPDRELTQTLGAFLEGRGYRVSLLHDGPAAIEACEKKLPRFLVLEGVLPKLTGLDVVKKVRAMPEGGLVSVILISTLYAGARFRMEISRAGVDEVLAKPFTAEDLLKRIESGEPDQRRPRDPAPAPKVEEFHHDGSLASVPFGRVVFHLYSRKGTGTLRLQNGTTKKLVTFEEGEPKFVVSNLERECLGRLLVSKGRLSEEECRASLEAMGKLNRRQGETLIQLGFLEPYELDEALRNQAREKFCEIFSWREGNYLFVPGKVFNKDLTPLDLNVAQLCLRGVRQYYNLASLQTVLAPYLNSPPRFRSEAVFSVEDFRLATWDARLVPKIKMGKTLADVLKLNLTREIDVYHLFYTFFLLDVIKFEALPVKEAVVPAARAETLGERMGQPSPFEVLGVSITAGDTEIRRAFEEKVSDIGSAKDRHEKEKILRGAFESIGSMEGRRDYLLRLYQEAGTLPRGVSGIFQAREFLSIGKRFLAEKDLGKARRVFLDGATLFPEDSLMLAFLGYVTVLSAVQGGESKGREYERGKKAIIKATQLMSDQADAHYLVSQVFLLEGEYEKARKALKRTLTLDPGHPLAASDLRACEKRLEKDQPSTSSIFKWKL